jgi:periplasmic protein TonB
MNNLSIFDKKWIDVVFDGKNKEYGAYQLRQESPKTAMRAFGFGSLLIVSVLGIVTLSSFHSNDSIKVDDNGGIVIHLTDLNHPVEPIIPIVEIEKTETKRDFTEDKIMTSNVKVAASTNADNIVKNDDTNKVTNNPNETNTNGKLPDTNSNPTSGTAGTVVTAPKVVDNTPKSLKQLDVAPSFPNGMDKFYGYIAKNFDKSDLDEDTGMITVKVSFIVEKDGSISTIKVLEDPGYGMGEEAIRVLKSLKTKWIPGLLDGEPMRTLYTLPISLKI